MTHVSTRTPKWKVVSRIAGLTIVFSVLVLLMVSAFTGRSYDSFTAETLLVIAAGLLGVPSVGGLIRGRNGNGSG